MEDINNQLHELLKDVKNDDLMYYIYSRRSDICVLQWYSPEHIKEITGTNASIETIIENWEQIQSYLTSDYIMETCNEHLCEMSDYAEDWELGELFPSDDEEE